MGRARRSWGRAKEALRFGGWPGPHGRRAVEPEAVGKAVLGELADGHREVLHEAREIAEAEIHDLDSAVFGEREDVFGRFCHVYLLSKRPGTPESQGSGRGQDYVPTSFDAMAAAVRGV